MFHKWTLALSALAAVAACHSSSSSSSRGDQADRASTTELTSLNMVANDNGVIRITNARCDHEAACRSIGPGQRYQDQNACMREVHDRVQSQLTLDSCREVDQAKVAHCVSDIQTQACGVAFDNVESIASCRRSEICSK